MGTGSIMSFLNHINTLSKSLCKLWWALLQRKQSDIINWIFHNLLCWPFPESLTIGFHIYIYVFIYTHNSTAVFKSKCAIKKKKADPSGGMIHLLLERFSIRSKAVCHIWDILQNRFSTFFPTTSMFTAQAI